MAVGNVWYTSRRDAAGGTQVGRRWDAGGTQEKINSSGRGFGV